jgi:hypothetical protein
MWTVGGGDLSTGVDPDIPVKAAAMIGSQDDPVLLRAMKFVSGQ